MSPMGAWEDGFAAGYTAAQEALRPWLTALGTADWAEANLGSRRRRDLAPKKAKRSRAPSAYNKRLGAAIKRLNKRAKKKDGNYRKGWSRSKVFKLAHKEARRK